MKVNQIATILNEVIIPNDLGETKDAYETVQEDLSNIVDIGKKILGTDVIGEDNFDNFMRKIIDKIGKTIFVDRTYTASGPDIEVDGWEYGSALEKIRCELPDVDENKSWTLASLANGDSVDPFVITKPSVSAKYFNSKTTFEIPMTFAYEQVKESFTSAANMNRLFSMIENRIKMKKSLCTEAMKKRTINNLIANKINATQFIPTVTNYNAATGSSLTADNALYNKEYLRYLAREMMMHKEFLKTASSHFNEDDYVTFTPEDKLKFVVISDVAKAMETILYSDTFHDEFVKMNGYSEIPFWQIFDPASGPAHFANRSKIDIKAINSGGQEFEVSKSGILGVMFDIDAAMICNQNDRVTSIYNPKAEYWNYFYKYDCMYLNDLAENVIVFTLT